MILKQRFLAAILCLFALPAMTAFADPVDFDSTNFPFVDPEVTLGGASMLMEESPDPFFFSVVAINDPFFGDPVLVTVVAGETTTVSFDWDFDNLGVDAFSAFILDPGAIFPEADLVNLAIFETVGGSDTTTWVVSDFLAPGDWGLQFELVTDWDFLGNDGNRDSTVLVSNLDVTIQDDSADPIPEPASILLLTLGGGALAYRRRRRARA